MDHILERIRDIIGKVSAAMEVVFLMVVISACAVFWAALLISFDERRVQSALLRALGADRKNVARRYLAEQVVVGFGAGLLGAICLAVVSWLLSIKVLQIDWVFPTGYCLALTVILIVLLSLISFFQLRHILTLSPGYLLRKPDAL